MTPDRASAPPRRRLVLACRTAFFGAAAIALAAALIPAKDHPPELFGWDKADHFAVFAGLMGLGALGFPHRRLATVGLWLVLFGAAIELLQALPFIDRDSDAADLLADTVGLLASAGPASWLRRRAGLRPPRE